MQHDYPKIMGRLSRLFRFMGWLSLIGFGLQIVAVIRDRDMQGLNPLATLLVCAACFAAYISLDFLLDLSERLAYMEKLQGQQNKVLGKLYQKANDEIETELA